MYKAKEVKRIPIIFDNEKYLYEKCNRVTKNAIEDRHANVTRAQPVKQKRFIRGEYEQNGLHYKRNKRLEKNSATRRPVHMPGNEDSFEKYGPVNRNRFNHVTQGQKGKYNKLHKKNNSKKIEEENSDDDTSTDVEMLDNNEVIKKRTSSVLVPSTIYRSDFGVSKASSDYREKVLNFLKKPFDIEEYHILSEEVKSYLAKYPNLKMKLNQYRYKRLTHMTILRGFFYWLENVMHDEAFQPWEDSQCLAVMPRSGLGN